MFSERSEHPLPSSKPRCAPPCSGGFLHLLVWHRCSQVIRSCIPLSCSGFVNTVFLIVYCAENLTLKPTKLNSEKLKPRYISGLKATKINVQWYLFCVSVVCFNFAELMNIWQREGLKICNMLVIRLMTFMHLLEIAIAVCPFFSGPICWSKSFCSGLCCVSLLLLTVRR